MANNGMILIACKAPNGVVLNLDRYEAIGDKGVIRRLAGETTVTLKGWARPWGAPDTTEGGYALTPVPAEFWEAWLQTHADSPLLKDKIILPPHKDARAQAVDFAEVPQMNRPARVGDVPGVEAGKVA
jgi:hypothetical protein